MFSMTEPSYTCSFIFLFFTKSLQIGKKITKFSSHWLQQGAEAMFYPSKNLTQASLFITLELKCELVGAWLSGRCDRQHGLSAPTKILHIILLTAHLTARSMVCDTGTDSCHLQLHGGVCGFTLHHVKMGISDPLHSRPSWPRWRRPASCS